MQTESKTGPREKDPAPVKKPGPAGKIRILMIDDDASILKIVGLLFKTRAYEIVTSPGGEAARDLLLNREFDLLLTDVRMAPIDGLEFLRLARTRWPAMPVVMMSGYTTLDGVQQAMKLGAFDYVRKPPRAEELLDLVGRALEYGRQLALEIAGVPLTAVRRYLGGMVAESDAMKKVCEMIKRAAPTVVPVLFCGERGVGKSLAARTVHELSRRNEAAFLSVNCTEYWDDQLIIKLFGHGHSDWDPAIMPADGEPVFLRANGGTVLLERIESVGMNVQQELLKVLTTKTIVCTQDGGRSEVPTDIRLVVAAEKDLNELVEAELFLEELYDRLSLMPIHVPRLAERREDILPLAHYLVGRQAEESGQPIPKVDPGVLEPMKSYVWPGNVDEMTEVIGEILSRAREGRVSEAALPAWLQGTRPGSDMPR